MLKKDVFAIWNILRHVVESISNNIESSFYHKKVKKDKWVFNSCNMTISKSKLLKSNVSINIWNEMFFWWLKPLFCRKKSDCINIEDLHDVSVENNSQLLGDKLERQWNGELNRTNLTNKKPSLLEATWKTFGWLFLYYGIHVFFICVILRGFQPYVLGRVIEHFDGRAKSSTEEFYCYAIALIVMVLSQAVVGHHSVVGRKVVGMRMSIAYSSLIYRKILRLSIAASNNYNAGKITNILSNDLNKFEDLIVFLHYLWILPIQGIVTIYFIWKDVGVASLVGISFLVLQAIPIQGFLAKMTGKLRRKVALKTDERVRLVSEIVNGIRVIKMYAWEKPFVDLVSHARRIEVNAIAAKSYLRGLTVAVSFFAENLSLFFVIAAYVLLGNPLQASIVYSLAQYFGMIKIMLTVFYPRAMSSAAEARVSIKRVEEFLLLDEAPMKSRIDIMDGNDVCGVRMKNVSVSWNDESNESVLSNINVEFSGEKLYIVTGPVGSGKSTLLKVILNELNLIKGELQVNGTISYACQESWLFPSTIRNNIVFGQSFDKERYDQVIDACALQDDFQTLPNGDLTVVGDRGTTLSGGQCARINLARAVYRNADTYLVDDPLASVDVHVGQHLFDKCINGLLKNKIRVLVTHNSKYFDEANEIILLNNGQIEFGGAWSNFKDRGYHSERTKLSNNSTEEIRQKEMSSSENVNDLNLIKRKTKTQSTDLKDNKLRNVDNTKFIWWKYFRAGGSSIVLFFLALTLVLSQMSVSVCDYWLAHWIKQEESNDKELPKNNFLTVALIVFAILLFTSVFLWTASTLLFYKICMNASKNLHKQMFSCLLKAPMNFFNLNVPGRILNRFSKDTGLVDETLPTITLDALHVILMVIGVIIQTLIISWWMLFPITVVIVVCWKFKNIYLPTAQTIRRLESEAKSPIFSHVSSTISGLTTIRSAKMQEKAKIEFDSLQNIHSSAHYLNIASGSAFGFWLDIISISLLAFVVFGFTFVKNDVTYAGTVGLAITQILMLYGSVQYGLRQITEMMMQMISVERIFEFTNLEQEGPFETEFEKTLESWPTHGQIEFKSVCLKYFDNEEDVLKAVSFCIKSREKIGIIGRTGAGKTSITSALFRLFNYEGSIYIDGVDIKTCGLRSLRSKMSVIPQNPILFTASIKQNLDPLQNYNDEVIWRALKDVGLNDRFDSLESRIESGGNNLSTGEKQLFCLARAIIANNKVLLLDEATANIDSSTDQLIQQIIKRKFADCTILTIAHRWNTILDSDKILVVDHGKIVEFDTPPKLAKRTDGSFFNFENM